VTIFTIRAGEGGTDQGVATVYQKHSSVRSRKAMYTL
jgi:hypothetical protein